MAKKIYSETAQARIMADALKTNDPNVIALAMARIDGQSPKVYLKALDGQQPCADCPDYISDKVR